MWCGADGVGGAAAVSTARAVCACVCVRARAHGVVDPADGLGRGAAGDELRTDRVGRAAGVITGEGYGAVSGAACTCGVTMLLCGRELACEHGVAILFCGGVACIYGVTILLGGRELARKHYATIILCGRQLAHECAVPKSLRG